MATLPLPGRAIAITNSFQDRAVGFGLDPDRVMSGVDGSLFTRIVIDRSVQIAAEQRADAAEERLAAGSSFDTVEPSLRSQIVAPVIGGASILTAEISRSLRGSKLVREPNGTLFEQAADGTLTEVGRNDLFKLADGRTLQLVDRGQGRMEWVEVPGTFDSFFTDKALAEEQRMHLSTLPDSPLTR